VGNVVSPLEDLRVDRSRLVDRLARLATIGPIAGDGSCRLALTDEDGAGRRLVSGWMRDLGLDVVVDPVGNVVGTRAGRQPGLAPVLCGSHIDTVATGGRFDGNLGVLAGLEVVETLNDAAATTRRPLAIAFFTDEEGARFAPDMLGSLVFVGGMTVAAARAVVGIDGSTVGAELDRIGWAGTGPNPFPAPAAYVELHIEQGPVLEHEGVDVGAVTGVQAISWTEVTISGQSNHAGTTPMALRHDAAVAAAEVAVFVRRLALDLGGQQVGTVGAVTLRPNLVNVVANTAALTVDLRNTDEAVLEEAERRLGAFLVALAEQEGVGIKWRSLARFGPVDFDPGVVALVEATARRLGHSVRRLPSGAGHDAQMLARVCPAGMVFVPSVAGISHNPAELTHDADLERGANVLLQTLVALTERDLAPTATAAARASS
jgi:N-carbamoyl-L-amino-acid hydrolase